MVVAIKRVPAQCPGYTQFLPMSTKHSMRLPERYGVVIRKQAYLKDNKDETRLQKASEDMLV